MKNIVKILSVGVAALLTSTAVQAQDVILNWDSSFEGLALSDGGQSTLSTGVIEIGWLNAGTTQAQIQALFGAGNLAGIDAVFNTVSTLTFSIGSPNSFGNGLVFESFTLADDGSGTYAADLAAYKDGTTGPAGEQAFGWVRNNATIGLTTEMAFIDANTTFGLANDTNFFSDFQTNAASDSFTITPAHVWVGSLSLVQLGGGVDLNGGSLADSTGLNGGSSVLETAAVVPEPSTAALALIGLAGFFGIRRRRA
jgi:hypothetical protein